MEKALDTTDYIQNTADFVQKAELKLSPYEIECLHLIRRAKTWSVESKNRILETCAGVELKRVTRSILFPA